MPAAVIVIAVAGVTILLGLAVQTSRRLRGFEHLPTHFDWRGRADAFGPAWVILWFVPGILMSTLALIAAIMIFVPREAQNGNPVVGTLITVLTLTGTQILIAWLLRRWAATQGSP